MSNAEIVAGKIRGLVDQLREAQPELSFDAALEIVITGLASMGAPVAKAIVDLVAGSTPPPRPNRAQRRARRRG